MHILENMQISLELQEFCRSPKRRNNRTSCSFPCTIMHVPHRSAHKSQKHLKFVLCEKSKPTESFFSFCWLNWPFTIEAQWTEEGPTHGHSYGFISLDWRSPNERENHCRGKKKVIAHISYVSRSPALLLYGHFKTIVWKMEIWLL